MLPNPSPVMFKSNVIFPPSKPLLVLLFLGLLKDIRLQQVQTWTFYFFHILCPREGVPVPRNMYMLWTSW